MQLGGSLALVRCSLNPGHEANQSVQVRKVPVSDPSTCSNMRSRNVDLLEHLVRTGEQRGRHGKTKRVCGLQVDDELVLPVQFDRQFSRSSNAGLAAAKAKGVKLGRKQKLTDHQQDEALKRLAAGESCRQIARTMAVHHSTIARLAG